MGIWGTQAHENDDAGDWFVGVFEDTNLRGRWLAGIELDIDEHWAEVRAAVWMFIQLSDVWHRPDGDYKQDLDIAIDAADRLRNHAPLQEVPSLFEQVNAEYELLAARRAQWLAVQRAAAENCRIAEMRP